MKRSLPWSYWFAGALSGAAWFLVALGLDNSWAIPRNSPLFMGAIILADIITGEMVSFLFFRPFEKSRLWLFFILPLMTLPIAIAAFAVLVWLLRQIFGVHFEPALSRADELGLILGTYLIVLITIFAPFLYGFALLNQYAMRRLLRKKAPNQTPEPTRFAGGSS